MISRLKQFMAGPIASATFRISSVLGEKGLSLVLANASWLGLIVVTPSVDVC